MDTETKTSQIQDGISSSVPEQKPVNQQIDFPKRLMVMVVLASLIGGSIAGAGVTSLVYKNGFPKGSGNSGFTQQQISLSEDSATVDVVKKASPAVVSIVVSKDLSKIPGYGTSPFYWDPFGFFSQSQQSQSAQPNVQKVGAGSGFLVSADGLIVTNKHVVEDAQASYTVITNEGQSYDAKVLARDPVNDVAIVKIEISNAPYLSWADSKSLAIGQHVIAIGNSLGEYQNTVTSGIISGIGRSITAGSQTGAEQLSGVIQTDAAINPGNSGGPLLNVQGQVVGINTAMDQQGQLVGFAIPSNDAKKALESYQKYGRIVRPYMGVRYVQVTPALAKQMNLGRDYGALIVRGQNYNDAAVISGGPAEKAGLMENDIILEAGGKKIDEHTTLTSILNDYNPGDTIQLKVNHQGQEKDVSITLGETK